MTKIFHRIFAKRVNTFCAFCRIPRKVYKKRRIGPGDIFSSLLGALILMGLLFQELDARAIFFFVGLLFISETFIQLRWRTGVVCPHCGFDPVIYVKEPEKAAQKVRAHLDKRADDPARYLGPAMNIPSRKAPPKPQEQKGKPGAPPVRKGQRLSKQI